MKKDTPTETYKLKGREVLVKRDDLMGDGNTLPPWGKLAGIDRLLHRYINPKYPLIHLAVNGSWSGWALSHLCKQRDIKFVYAYPPSKTYSRFILNKAKENGCETGIFCGDWHHNRNTINVQTLDSTTRCLEKLGKAFEKFYFFAGNHDLYYKDKRDIYSLEFGKHIPGITYVDEIMEEDDVALVPWLVGDEC